MQALYDVRGRDADGGDEQCRAFVDDDVDELVQEAVCVVVVCFAGGAAEGGEGEVDAEGEGGGREEGFEVVDHGAQVGGGVAEAADDAEAAVVGDGGGEGGGGGVGHAGEEDGVGYGEEGC